MKAMWSGHCTTLLSSAVGKNRVTEREREPLKALYKNKRPRDLNVLLGHLLDKRISVWYKLTTIVAVQISLKI